jgi:two-component system copper resistance phosphate regulon response regulator CusR/two-component system response regulator QseB
MRILIVEDKQSMAATLRRLLQEQAYAVEAVRTCAQARDALCETDYDLVILDLGLPDGDGLALLREWRSARFETPVLILSARDAVHDRVSGLNLGADDYLAKPFNTDELLARVRALMRRQSSNKTTNLTHGNLALDLGTRSAAVGGKEVELTAREFALLELFLVNRGRLMPKSLICEKVWDSRYDVDSNLLEVYIWKLRNKLEPLLGTPLIKTVRGVGYRLA